LKLKGLAFNGLIVAQQRHLSTGEMSQIALAPHSGRSLRWILEWLETSLVGGDGIQHKW
jgi:hypothetical protein